MKFDSLFIKIITVKVVIVNIQALYTNWFLNQKLITQWSFHVHLQLIFYWQKYIPSPISKKKNIPISRHTQINFCFYSNEKKKWKKFHLSHLSFVFLPEYKKKPTRLPMLLVSSKNDKSIIQLKIKNVCAL